MSATKKKLLFLGIAIIVCLVISLQTPPEGMTKEAMIFAGLFVSMIMLLIVQVIPDWVVVLATTTLLVILKVAKIPEVYSAFSGSTIWLIIMVFTLSTGISNSGLLTRVALKILTFFPQSYKGAVLALMSSGLIVGPLIPSVNAKVNIIIPVATAVTEQVGLPERSKGALGLFSASYMTIMLGGNAFISGSVYVAIMIGFLPGSNFSLVSWLAATSIFLLAILIGTYIYCTWYCKPESELKFPPNYFKGKLSELGSVSRNEKFAGTLLVICLVVWTTAKLHGADTGMVGLLAVCIMAAYGLITGADFIGKVPWTLIVFIGGLLGMASLITTLGWGDFIAGLLGGVFAPIVSSPWIFVPFLCIFTYLLRFVVIEQLTSLVVTLAIFSPLMEQAGMNLFVLVFVQFMAAMVWNVPYQNPYPLATIQVAGGKYVTFAELRQSSYAYMIICLIGMTASIPLWQALGYIW
jgi:DASS family divalent anion:Na+ symporter